MTREEIEGSRDLISLKCELRAELHEQLAFKAKKAEEKDEKLSKIHSLLSRGAEPNNSEIQINNTLSIAISKDNPIEILRLLVEFGAKPLNLSYAGNALTQALLRNSFRVKVEPFKKIELFNKIKLLISAGAEPNNLEDYNTLSEATSNNISIETLKLLIDNGAKPSNSQNEYNTLSKALSNNAPREKIELLISAGAKPNNSCDIVYNTLFKALSIKATRKKKEILKLLFKVGANIEDIESIGESQFIELNKFRNELVSSEAYQIATNITRESGSFLEVPEEVITDIVHLASFYDNAKRSEISRAVNHGAQVTRNIVNDRKKSPVGAKSAVNIGQPEAAEAEAEHRSTAKTFHFYLDNNQVEKMATSHNAALPDGCLKFLPEEVKNFLLESIEGGRYEELQVSFSKKEGYDIKTESLHMVALLNSLIAKLTTNPPNSTFADGEIRRITAIKKGDSARGGLAFSLAKTYHK